MKELVGRLRENPGPGLVASGRGGVSDGVIAGWNSESAGGSHSRFSAAQGLRRLGSVAIPGGAFSSRGLNVTRGNVGGAEPGAGRGIVIPEQHDSFCRMLIASIAAGSIGRGLPQGKVHEPKRR